MTSYTVNVTRDGRWWMIAVPELDALTQARSLTDVKPMAQDLIASLLDVDPATVDVTVHLGPIGGHDVGNDIDILVRDREELIRIQAKVSTTTRTIAHTLASEGVTVRDIGTVLGVSFQRAQQLLDA